MKKVTFIAVLVFSMISVAARGQEVMARDEQGLKHLLKPAKIQLFAGVGEISIDGNQVADIRLTGVAGIYPFGEQKRFFLRPYASVGQVDPLKSGVDNFEVVQTGMLIGRVFNKRFSAAVGVSLTTLFTGDTEYRETLNFATVTNLWKSEKGTLQLLTPIALNETRDGRANVVATVAIGWLF